MSKAAMAHLAQDGRMAALIARVGPPRLGVMRGRSPYEALVRAIAHQQLHGRAAEAILGRFIQFAGDGTAFPQPGQIRALSDIQMRGVGFSAAKTAAIRAIALHAEAGRLPSRRQAARLSDAVLIERLSEIRGVGRWTVEMLLIFTLGRQDVLPAADFGVAEGCRALYGLAERPHPRDLAARMQCFAPYRSYAAWYLWRAADLARQDAAAIAPV
ncbi:MAG: DNA-3-methyladenine glycosylase 2 family protein [Rhodospirillales bacterium]|nr:DNA-3-methyladenine glycosylase 2 family protein [Rhodospirillales bacterium]